MARNFRNPRLVPISFLSGGESGLYMSVCQSDETVVTPRSLVYIWLALALYTYKVRYFQANRVALCELWHRLS